MDVTLDNELEMVKKMRGQAMRGQADGWVTLDDSRPWGEERLN